MAKRVCAHCGRGLGLVSYSWWRLRFCSRAHRELYKRKDQEEVAARKRWHEYLFHK